MINKMKMRNRIWVKKVNQNRKNKGNQLNNKKQKNKIKKI